MKVLPLLTFFALGSAAFAFADDHAPPENDLDLLKPFYEKYAKSGVQDDTRLSKDSLKEKRDARIVTVVAKKANVEPTAGCSECKSSLFFAGDEAKKYEVGSRIPGLPFKTKTSWSGLIPVTPDGQENFFFWMWGSDTIKADDNLVIWLNGGPGCSSLGGMLMENGPFLYMDKKKEPYVNEYSWLKSTNMLYVEMPIGTGFTTGKFTYHNEDEIAEQFQVFLDNFFKTFPEMVGKDLYIVGESYGSYYMTYILNRLYSNGNKFNAKGGMIVSGILADGVVANNVPLYNYVKKWAKIMGFSPSDLAKIKKASDQCGYTDFVKKYVRYPSQGKLPTPRQDGCGILDAYYAPPNVNFNPYRVTKPINDSPLGFLLNPNETTFFDHADLQRYIHAPPKKWGFCQDVFGKHDSMHPYGDHSLPINQSPSYEHNILTDVIEKSTNGLVIMGGLEDAEVQVEGARIALQNLTWGGVQGFNREPVQKLIDVDGKISGTWASERGLTFAIVNHAGHQIPFDAQATGIAALEAMLNRRTLDGAKKGLVHIRRED